MKSGPDGSLTPHGGAGPQPVGPECHRGGIALVTAALPRCPFGPYQLQAAIAALHDEAQSPEATDWPQIAALYDVLLRLDDNPVVAPNHAVAISMVAGSRAGLELVQRLGALGQRRSSLLRGPRPPPRQGWPPCRRARGVPSRSPGRHEPPAAALPQSTGRSPAGPVGHLTVTSRTTPASRESWASGSTGPDGLEVLLRQQG